MFRLKVQSCSSKEQSTMFTQKVQSGSSKEQSTMLQRKHKVDPEKNKVQC